jgi:hypothetical protein
MSMTGQNNQAIAHIAYQAGGTPFCKSKRALICVAVEDADKWAKVCTRCAAKLAAKKTLRTK